MSPRDGDVVVLFPGGHGKPQLRPFPFTAGRDLPPCLLAGEQHNRAGGSDETTRPADREEADLAAFHHDPVMLDEVLDLFARPADGGDEQRVVVDATLGGGGHAAALLAADSLLHVIGLDRDRHAIEAATSSFGVSPSTT